MVWLTHYDETISRNETCSSFFSILPSPVLDLPVPAITQTTLVRYSNWTGTVQSERQLVLFLRTKIKSRKYMIRIRVIESRDFSTQIRTVQEEASGRSCWGFTVRKHVVYHRIDPCFFRKESKENYSTWRYLGEKKNTGKAKRLGLYKLYSTVGKKERKRSQC